MNGSVGSRGDIGEDEDEVEKEDEERIISR